MIKQPCLGIYPQPFVIGETVIAVSAIPKARIKNGKLYKVNSCETDYGTDGVLYWYVGVEGEHNRLRPSIFLPYNRP